MANLADALSFESLSTARFKREWGCFAHAVGFTHAFTLAWNREVGLDRARLDLRRFHARIDERFFGRHFAKVPGPKRSVAVFVFEGLGTHAHVHGLWKVPAADKLLRFHRCWPESSGGVWNDVVPSGSYSLSIIRDHAEAVGYMLKHHRMSADDRHMVWSQEFLGRG